MALISGIYDSNPIQPVAKIRENLSIWTTGKWRHYRIENIEPMPRSRPSIVDLVALSAAPTGTILANGTIAANVLNIFQLDENNESVEMLGLRWEAIDDVEGVLWEQQSVGRFVSRSIAARVDLLTGVRDPYLATTSFFVLGRDRTPYLSVFNPRPVAQPTARFAFWGHRYALSNLPADTVMQIEKGQRVTTWLPAEGFGVGAFEPPK
jgi:hypothetical protein